MAFGRQFELDQAQLGQLKGMRISGVRLTYEAGYPETGGRTLYLLFSMGRTEQLVTLSERGDIQVGRPHRP